MERHWIDLKCSSPYMFASEVFSLFWAVVINAVLKIQQPTRSHLPAVGLGHPKAYITYIRFVFQPSDSWYICKLIGGITTHITLADSPFSNCCAQAILVSISCVEFGVISSLSMMDKKRVIKLQIEKISLAVRLSTDVKIGHSNNGFILLRIGNYQSWLYNTYYSMYDQLFNTQHSHALLPCSVDCNRNCSSARLFTGTIENKIRIFNMNCPSITFSYSKSLPTKI